MTCVLSPEGRRVPTMCSTYLCPHSASNTSSSSHTQTHTHAQMRVYEVNGGVGAYDHSGYVLFMLSRLLSPTHFLYPSWNPSRFYFASWRETLATSQETFWSVGMSERKKKGKREWEMTPDIAISSRRHQCTRPRSDSALAQRRGLCKPECGWREGRRDGDA